MHDQQLINHFVNAVNLFHGRPVIVPYENINWVNQLEQDLTLKLPSVYRYLLSHFIFDAFDIGGIMFFGNSLNNAQEDDLRARLSADPAFSAVLPRHGFLLFGQPDTGSYDPICFSAHSKKRPIVRLDHELILQFEKIRIVENIADSFEAFVLHLKAGPDTSAP